MDKIKSINKNLSEKKFKNSYTNKSTVDFNLKITKIESLFFIASYKKKHKNKNAKIIISNIFHYDINEKVKNPSIKNIKDKYYNKKDGLQNLGCTCYLNSFICRKIHQIIFFIKK